MAGPRVLLVTGEYPPDQGGVGDYTARLARQLGALGLQCFVLTHRPAAPADAAEAGEPGEPLVLRKVPAWDRRAWDWVVACARNVDVVHLQYQAGAYDLRGEVCLLPLVLRRRAPGVRSVTTFHDLLVPYLFPKAGPLRRLAVRTLLATSHAAIFSDREDLLRAGAGPGRYWVPIGSNVEPVPLAPNERAALRTRLGVGPDELLVGHFGLSHPTKGLETLVAALGRLAAGGRPATLLLIGPQPFTLRPLSLPVGEGEGAGGVRVLRTGYLPEAEVSAHLQACDLVALPYRDGASLRRGSLMAALAHGLPIVSTRRAGYQPDPAAPWEVRDGEHALLVPPDDPGALAAALARLADDAALRTRLAAGARRLGAELSWERIGRATAEVYAALGR